MLAIPLLRRDVREYDQMVTLYTKEQGRFEVLARGVKKSVSKNAAFLEPFFVIDAEWIEGKEKTHLTKVFPLQCFDAIRNNLVAMQLLAYSLELFLIMVPEQEKDDILFNLLVSWFSYLQTGELNAFSIDAFIIKLWGHLGFLMVYERCVVCGNEDVVALFPKGGGVICAACAEEKHSAKELVLPLALPAIVSLQLIAKNDFSIIQKNKLQLGRELHDAIMAFAMYHSSKRLPTFRIL